MQRILVGVDASPNAEEAVRYAADEARRHGASLEVVYAFEPPEKAAAFPAMPDKGRDRVDTERAKEQADKDLGEWLEKIDVNLDDLDVRWTVVPDKRPSRAMIERSENCDLLVVGSRGHGGFKGLRLGSVSEQVVRHARCPVLVTRKD
ncbi:universal stress protein [Egibacter rhizosphaerae]|uniref:Universal stress protein n=1 Tax=Egibacter rhizosphaerae TaxID=1670831 RepID=A0A411YI44_9ACTN|nr:universal stress protein [Egibacter rhizosphaerae]QBI20954.1 universal stress protein [Egibacter rhizosphaerae]